MFELRDSNYRMEVMRNAEGKFFCLNWRKFELTCVRIIECLLYIYIMGEQTIYHGRTIDVMDEQPIHDLNKTLSPHEELYYF